MATMFPKSKPFGKGHVSKIVNAHDFRSLYPSGMITRIGTRRAMRFYLREWREHRGWTQEELASRMNTEKGTISKLENGRANWKPKWVTAAAHAFDFDDEMTIFRHPDQPSPESLLATATAEQRAQVIAVVAALLKPTGTN